MTNPIDSVRSERQDRRDRHLDRVNTAAGLVAVALLAALVWYAWESQDTAEEAVAVSQSLGQQVAVACAADGAAQAELDAIGACDRAEDAARGAASPAVPVVEVASAEQVRTAVADYLQRHPPQAGRAPSPDEVDAAVARYCGENMCRGEVGDGGPEGPEGRAATDDQVAAQVATYCDANNRCRPTTEEIGEAVQLYCSAQPSPCVGPSGEPGAPGQPGQPGEPGPVLPEYYQTRPDTLGVGTVTFHCVLRTQGEPPEPVRPIHYDCK
jgi:hypothetical protein